MTIGNLSMRDLPPDSGDWKNTHRRYCQWRDAGVRERLPEQLITEADYEWLMIDASYIKAHEQAVGGNRAIGRTKGGLTRNCTWPWMRMVCRSEQLLLQVPKRIVNLLGL